MAKKKYSTPKPDPNKNELANLRGYLVSNNAGTLFRITGFRRGTELRLVDLDHNNAVHYEDAATVKSNYRFLKESGVLIINVVEVIKDDSNAKDVITSLFRESDMDKGIPFAMCRQNIHNIFDTMRYNNDASKSATYIIGCSVSQETIPANVNIMDLMSCSRIVSTLRLRIYHTDTLDDIMMCIGSHHKEMDDALLSLKAGYYRLKKQQPEMTTFDGYCDSIRELYETVDFMYDFYRAFGIMKVNYSIGTNLDSLDTETYEKICLELGYWINNPIVLEYGEDVNVEKITSDKLLIEAQNGRYIIVFDKGDRIADEQTYQELFNKYHTEVFGQ